VENDSVGCFGLLRQRAAVAIGNVANALAEAVQSLGLGGRDVLWRGPVAVGDVASGRLLVQHERMDRGQARDEAEVRLT
jgi:acyl dehydratase